MIRATQLVLCVPQWALIDLVNGPCDQGRLIFPQKLKVSMLANMSIWSVSILFISAGSEKMKTSKLCNLRSGGSSLYCRRTDGTKKQSLSINKCQSFKQELFFGYRVCLSKEKSTIESEYINTSSYYKHYLHHKMNSIVLRGIF